MSVQNTARIQRYRANIAQEGLTRMEVTLSRTLVGQARELARHRRMPFWYFVERAIVAYATVSGNDSRSGAAIGRTSTDDRSPAMLNGIW